MYFPQHHPAKDSTAMDYNNLPLFYPFESVIFVVILQIRGVYAFRNEI
jgi:hypothetical protein